MTLCKDCTYMMVDPNDNGMGECIGFAASPFVEITSNETPVQIYFRIDKMGCLLGSPRDTTTTTASG